MSSTGIEPTTLSRIVDAIVLATNPVRVILFGSAARGEARTDSDIDIFIEIDDGKSIGETSEKAYAAIDPLYSEVKRGVDIVVRDRSFVERYGDLVGTVVRPVLREGKVLYARG